MTAFSRRAFSCSKAERCSFSSAVAKLVVVWLLSDIMNALMAFPNLIDHLLLAGIVWRQTRSYFSRYPLE